MKHLATILAFLLISLNGYCDTLDTWQVYINDKLVAEFNEFSKDLAINIRKNEIKSDDIITVRYGSDHPCADCYYGISVFAEVKRKVPEVQTKEHGGKLSISLKDLLEIQKTEGINKFPFNYYERTDRDKTTGRLPETKGRLLFVLNIT